MRHLRLVQPNEVFPTDHSKIASKLVFNFHSDSGHGWLAVKNSLIWELGLESKISKYSYMQGLTSYLEEDCDMSLFISAFELRFGHRPRTKELQSRDRSPIRSFKRFSMV
jgi:hypothetical protein